MVGAVLICSKEKLRFVPLVGNPVLCHIDSRED